ncbi:MAG TPA: hypothetical protein VGJ37_15490 [Pyrinomonadaceae bacterium]
MKKFWIIAAALCGVAALVFVFWGDYDKAFIAAALGAVAWFLNYRAGLRELYHRDETDDDEEADDENDQL